MIKVAFLLNFTKEYKGGINYIKNLLYACSVNKRSDVAFYLFVPADIEQEYIDTFSAYATVVKTGILKRGTPTWFVDKVLDKKFSASFFLLRLLKKYKIDVVSHSNFFSRYKGLKIINWVPDFQILHYPALWTDAERKRILNQYRDMVKYSDLIVLSSNDAFKDYRTFTTEKIDKVRVLQFVSQPGILTRAQFEKTQQEIVGKYNINRSFFYLPNQFWSHKNHITAFKAVNILKQKGLTPLLVTTGHMADYRNNKGLESTLSYVKDNNLTNNILLLGLIPYQEVLVLIKSCAALINPSLFEGWSSTVEEAKSSGKQIILADIPIHREQNPENGIYFNPLDEHELAAIMENVINQNSGKALGEYWVDQQVEDNLIKRTKLFAEKYYEIIDEAVADKSS
ncbi:glycosyltransferase [Mucilaginibacter sp. ZT4R22]|uniref:Glycosyltransferase n=1 Tax=Mucilaginibacter pankratovii TaxID=2772110 RepID=A0ABR7WS68_9SPHI|nr:glycosyltransferase [Mucilaginibacter pankratovii]MBD1364357.1 glycosyltransferase [Mucilaginibacter pankratovii]